MDYLPIFLSLRDKPCLLVAESIHALPKLTTLLDAGARVTLAGKSVPESALAQRVLQAGGTLAGVFSEKLLDDCWLALAASEDAVLNQHVAAAATARRIWINVVDTPALCTAILPATIDRSPLLIAVSSSGAAPMLATWTRQKIERLFPPAWQKLAQFAEQLRPLVNQRLPMGAERRQFWLDLLEHASEDLLNTQPAATAEWLENHLQQNSASPQPTPLYLIHPPAEPDLLSLRAWRWLSQADKVLYEKGTPPALLAYARREAILYELAGDTDTLDSQLQNACATPGQRVACLHSDTTGLAQTAALHALPVVTL